MEILIDVMTLAEVLFRIIAIALLTVLEFIWIRKLKSELSEKNGSEEGKENISKRERESEARKAETEKTDMREKVNKEVKEDNRKEEIQKPCIIPQYEKEEKLLPAVIMECKAENTIEKQDVISMREDDAQCILDFIRNKDKGKCVRIGTVSSKESIGRFVEREDGDLVVYHEEGERYAVVPVKECISEKEYRFSSLNMCYTVSQDIQQGVYYRIIAVEQKCLMEKGENFYQVVQIGHLRIEKM